MKVPAKILATMHTLVVQPGGRAFAIDGASHRQAGTREANEVALDSAG